MDFQEFGREDGKTLVLLPGTACTWQITFHKVIDELSARYRIIAVNYDGFEGSRKKVFTDVTTVTGALEDYIIEHHGGRVDAVYGSAIGGNIVALLLQNGRIHMDHGYIGGTDFDHGGALMGKIMTRFVGSVFSNACKSEQARVQLKEQFRNSSARGSGGPSADYTDAFVDNMANVNARSITNQFYSAYVTPIAKDLHQDGTTVHIIYALQMGEKYRKRYEQHFRTPDVHEYNMAHEAWLYDPEWLQTVLSMLCETLDA